MSKIIESLKKLTVENGSTARKSDKCCRPAKSKDELLVSVEEQIISDEQTYILGICGSQSEPEFRIAVALSDHSCAVYSVGQTFKRTIASDDGNVTACDLRAKGKVVAEFNDNTEDGKLKPLASFDISCDERLIAGGTEHIGGDAFILFWDVRYSHSKPNGNNSLLGGYWESHMDDITSLSFHPNKRDVLASGSTDGLINIFDLTQTSEDSALTYSLNTESSVDRVGWILNDHLWCTTHTHCLQLWNSEDATPFIQFDRNDLALSENDDLDSTYLVRIHTPATSSDPYLLAGSSSAKGELLQCLSFGKNKLEPCYNMPGNKQIVRDSWLHEKSGCLVTGGEAGIINIWKQSETNLTLRNSTTKHSKIGAEKSRCDKNHRTKPY